MIGAAAMRRLQRPDPAGYEGPGSYDFNAESALAR
jgi:hypothetical protein